MTRRSHFCSTAVAGELQHQSDLAYPEILEDQDDKRKQVLSGWSALINITQGILVLQSAAGKRSLFAQ
jgi:hypothetical protein